MEMGTERNKQVGLDIAAWIPVMTQCDGKTRTLFALTCKDAWKIHQDVAHVRAMLVWKEFVTWRIKNPFLKAMLDEDEEVFLCLIDMVRDYLVKIDSITSLSETSDTDASDHPYNEMLKRDLWTWFHTESDTMRIMEAEDDDTRLVTAQLLGKMEQDDDTEKIMQNANCWKFLKQDLLEILRYAHHYVALRNFARAAKALITLLRSISKNEKHLAFTSPASFHQIMNLLSPVFKRKYYEEILRCDERQYRYKYGTGLCIHDPSPKTHRVFPLDDTLDVLCNPESIVSPLHTAALGGSSRIVNMYIDGQGLLALERWRLDDVGFQPTAFNCAALRGHVDVLKTLLSRVRVEDPGFNFEDEDTINLSIDQKSSFYIACEKGHTHAAEYMISEGANPNAFFYDLYGWLSDDHTPFTCAVANGHTETVKMLLRYGRTKPDPEIYGKDTVSSLNMAILNDDVEMVNVLLQSPRVNVNSLSFIPGHIKSSFEEAPESEEKSSKPNPDDMPLDPAPEGNSDPDPDPHSSEFYRKQFLHTVQKEEEQNAKYAEELAQYFERKSNRLIGTKMTPLQLAVAKGNTIIRDMLLDHPLIDTSPLHPT